MKIAVAAPPYPSSLKNGLEWIDRLSREDASGGAVIICFPESYIPGYPHSAFKREEADPMQLRAALEEVQRIAKKTGIAIIIPMDWHSGGQLLNVAQW